MTITPKHAASLLRMARELGSRVGSASILSQAIGRFPVAPGIVNNNWRDSLSI
jgi:hypothetical protein